MNNKKVVIVGAGFGGLSLATRLKDVLVDITLIDRHNYHLFQPLLYQVATGGLSETDIAWPIRSIYKNQQNIHVIMEEVIGVDTAAQKVSTKTNAYPYDYLVLATGARHSYFGNEQWESFAPGIKNIKDALILREKILAAFEKAEMLEDKNQRDAYLTFVIVGAGPTGVEIAGALAELTRFTLAKDFRHITPQNTKIILIEAGPRILSSFPEKLAKAAMESLRQMGVEILINTRVKDILEDEVWLEKEKIVTKTIIWAAGVKASHAASWIKTQTDESGRIKVTPELKVPEYDNIFAIGDTCICKDQSGKTLPGVAPVAKQQGYYLAKYIKNLLANKKSRPFKYRNYGNLATIGRKYAVADFDFITLKGFFAWILWSVVHVYFLIGFKNRFSVAMSWLWSYFTFQRGARIIVDPFEKD